MNQNEKLRLLTVGLCCGDALGSTSEFLPQREAPKLYERHNGRGWPFAQVGEGPFDWEKGQHTDDGQMAVAMLRSFVQQGRFDPSDIANRFVGWLDSAPPDVGMATRRGLSAVRKGTPWNEGGLIEYVANQNSAANGSLMRNGVVAPMGENLWQAFEFSVQQSIITHYAPLPVLCCCAQTYLIWELLAGRDPFARPWMDDFFECFTEWLQECREPFVRGWFDKTVTQQTRAYQTFHDACFDPDSFQPFGYAFNEKDGYCLLTLQIAVWAALWSRRNEPYPTPKGFPKEVFERAVGPLFLAVVPMIGHDSDTYGACAGPLLAALHGQVPPELSDGLKVWRDLADLKLSVPA
jgi:ADP-ribosylglycohydrolase